MERKKRQSAFGYRPFIFLYSLSDGSILFMKNKGHKIVSFTKIIASRFINKDTQLSHGQSLRRYEKAIRVASPAAQLLSAGSGCHNGL